MNLIELESINYNRPGMDNPLRNIQLTVEAGDFVQLKGLSRAGKSTLVDFMLGIRQPDSGTVKILGESPNTLNHKFSLGVVLQKLRFPDQVAQLGMLIDLIESHYPEATGKVASTLEKFNYSLKQDKANLSGGEESIIFFALAQAGSPGLLILDEPTSNLDEKNRNIIWRELQKFHDLGGTVLLISHDSEIGVKPTKTFLLEEGQLVLILEGEDSRPNLPEKSISILSQPKQLGISHWSHLLFKHVKFNLLQIVQNDKKYIFLSLISSIIYALLPAFISNLSKNSDSDIMFKSIADYYTFYLALAAISSTGNTIAIERQDQTLKKLFKILPLPPIIYLSAKVITSLILVSSFVLVMIAVTLISHAFIYPSVLDNTLQSISSIFGSFPVWLVLSTGLILGIIPYLFLGLALGCLFGQRNVQVISLICTFILTLPIYTSQILPLIDVPNRNFLQLSADNIAVYSPMFHFNQFILFLANLPDYDQYIWLHLSWLIWFSFSSLLIAVWVYQSFLRKEAKA